METPERIEESPATAEENRALYAEQVKQLYSNALVGLLASVINSLILAVIQRNVISRATLIAWVALVAVIGLLRYLDIRRFWRRSPDASDAKRWGRRFIVGLVLSGVAWGSSAIFLFPIESLAHQTFLAFVVGGMVAGAAAAFSSVMIAFLSYSVPALSPIIVRFALLGDEFHLAMGGMTLLFGVMVFFIAKRINTVRTTSVKLRFENSDLVSYLTELRRMEDALRESEGRYRTLFEKSLDAVILADPSGKGTILSANPAACLMFGRTEQEMIGLSRDDMFAPDEPEMASLLRERERIGRYTGRLTYRRADGAAFPGEVSTSFFTDSNGNLRSVAIIRDITERKQAEEALRRARDDLELRVHERTGELRTTVDALHDEIEVRRKVEEELARQAELLNLTQDAIIARNLDQRVFFWNRGAEERYGWSSDEAKGRLTDGLLQTVYPRPWQEIEEELLLRGQWEGEVIHKTRNGSKITVVSRRALRRDKDGKPIAILEINSDITKQRHIEEQLRQTQKMEAMGTLAGGIAHDFNNVLAIIIGNAELAMDDPTEEMTVRRSLEQIFKASIRGRGLVRQILTFSRKAEHEREFLSFAPLIKETFDLLRASLPATIDMALNIKTSTGIVFADATQMQQVLMNLFSNAADVMRESGGRIEVGLVDTFFTEDVPLPGSDLKPGTYVTLTVKDTGPGMDEAVQKRIFEPFFTTKEKGQGTGLGLAVVYGIVKAHQGAITVSSEPGQGSTFTVYLPKYTSGEKAEPVTGHAVAKGKERILFVDDEKALVEVAEGLLHGLGYQAVGTTDSLDALQKFSERPDAFDLVITDQTMPKMTGTILAQKLKEIRPDIPVILCTGYSETISSEEAQSLGIQAFVMKPLSKDEMAETIRRVLDTKTQG